MELNLRFPENNQVIVTFDGQETDRLDFASPLSAADRKEIRWYLEIYAARYTTDVDDRRAEGIATKFRQWGEDLFNAVFQHRAAQRLFNDFQEQNQRGRLLTISASHPAILSLPWELLRDPQGTYLFHENPRISIRRRLVGAGGGRKPFKMQVKDRLRLLFMVSRPSDAGFIDPRGEAMAVLNAIQQEAAGRVEVEFLRPATLDNLVARLEDSRKPPVDIVHFDGHGVFDLDGRFQEQAKHSDPEGVTKGGNENGGNIGYLLFEDKEGKKALITAETLGDMLNRQRVGLIVLSACQSAAMDGEDGEDAMGCVAARLTHAGIPAVLAMTHSILVTTAHQLFAKFYQGLVSGAGMGEALDNALLEITEISESQWQTLRPALETTGLIQVDEPFIKFHPSLAPTLWPRLSPEAQTELLARYQQHYYQLSRYLYFKDDKNPHFARANVQRELPNLLYAVDGVLDAGAEWAVDFVYNVNFFLGKFGLNRDRTRLNQRIAELTGEVGSHTWYLSRTSSGEQLFNAGRYQEAAQVFSEILAELGEQPSYKCCATLANLGRCFEDQRQTSKKP